MSRISYFKGKVCTILTAPTTCHFTPDQHANVFVGIIEDIDELGIWVMQISKNKKSFFTFHSLIGIIEETVTTLTEEEVRQVHKTLESKLPEKNDKKLISIGGINNLKKQQENK